MQERMVGVVSFFYLPAFLMHQIESGAFLSLHSSKVKCIQGQARFLVTGFLIWVY